MNTEVVTGALLLFALCDFDWLTIYLLNGSEIMATLVLTKDTCSRVDSPFYFVCIQKEHRGMRAIIMIQFSTFMYAYILRVGRYTRLEVRPPPSLSWKRARPRRLLAGRSEAPHVFCVFEYNTLRNLCLPLYFSRALN